MKFFEKLKKALLNAFNDPLFPEPEVRKEMSKKGWTFEFNHYASPHGFAVATWVDVKTPDGKQALGVKRDEQAFQSYVAALEQTRKDLNISQP